MFNELIENLREDAEWAEANEWETPITLSDHLRQAVDAIEELQNRADYQRRQIDFLMQSKEET